MEVHLHLIFERGVKALAYTPMSERGTVGVVANAIFSEIESLLSMKEKIAFEQKKLLFCDTNSIFERRRVVSS